MDNVRKRIMLLLSDKALSVNKASLLLGIPQRTLNRQLNEEGTLSVELICALRNSFPDVSLDWIFSGEGSMYYSDSYASVNALPYYDSLPASAGVRDMVDGGSEIPSGYISIPNTKAEFLFPVAGTSMQPEINPGDIVGVKRIDACAMLDDKRIYMIVTRDERMIKHCSSFKDDSALLLCSSPNYPDFTIRKDDVIAMFEVVLRICNV